MSDDVEEPLDGPRSTRPPVRRRAEAERFSTSLQEQLDEMTQRTRELVQPERLAPSEQAVAELFSTGIEEHILAVGQQVA